MKEKVTEKPVFNNLLISAFNAVESAAAFAT